MNRIRKITLGAAALVASAGGVGLASMGSASAASSATQASTQASSSVVSVTTPVDPSAPVATDSSSTAAPTDTAKPKGPHSANGITETVLTGSDATSVEAAVKAAYPDATIDRMETDAEGAAFEAHITKADGSDATVKLDASFAVTGTVTGHG